MGYCGGIQDRPAFGGATDRDPRIFAPNDFAPLAERRQKFFFVYTVRLNVQLDFGPPLHNSFIVEFTLSGLFGLSLLLAAC